MILTYSGRLIDPFNLEDKDISIRDIAHALSNTGRWGGHTSRFYSVAEHCVRLVEFASCTDTLLDVDALYLNDAEIRDLQKYLLLHDASEAYLTDVPKPYKDRPEFRAFVEFEQRVQDKIQRFYGLDNFRQVIYVAGHSLDQRIIGNEAEQLMPVERLQYPLARPLPGEPDATHRVAYMETREKLWIQPSPNLPHVVVDRGEWGWTPDKAESIFLDQYTRLFGSAE